MWTVEHAGKLGGGLVLTFQCNYFHWPGLWLQQWDGFLRTPPPHTHTCSCTITSRALGVCACWRLLCCCLKWVEGCFCSVCWRQWWMKAILPKASPRACVWLTDSEWPVPGDGCHHRQVGETHRQWRMGLPFCKSLLCRFVDTNSTLCLPFPNDFFFVTFFFH